MATEHTHTHTYTMFVPAGETAAAGPQKEGHLKKETDGKENPSVPHVKARGRGEHRRAGTRHAARKAGAAG